MHNSKSAHCCDRSGLRLWSFSKVDHWLRLSEHIDGDSDF